jgi:hypothetical protein
MRNESFIINEKLSLNRSKEMKKAQLCWDQLVIGLGRHNRGPDTMCEWKLKTSLTWKWKVLEERNWMTWQRRRSRRRSAWSWTRRKDPAREKQWVGESMC